MNTDNLVGYDVISGGRNNFTGYMSLFRNVKAMRFLYQESPDHARVINSSSNFRFDENGGKRGIVAMEQVIRNNNISIKYLNCAHNDFGKIRDLVDNSDREWVYDWVDGKLTDRLTGEEIAMLHLMKSKANPNFTFQKFRDGSNFSISQTGLCYK